MKCSHYYIYSHTHTHTYTTKETVMGETGYKKQQLTFSQNHFGHGYVLCVCVIRYKTILSHPHRNCPTKKKDWRQDYWPPCSGSRPLWMNQRMTLRWYCSKVTTLILCSNSTWPEDNDVKTVNTAAHNAEHQLNLFPPVQTASPTKPRSFCEWTLA